MRRDYHRGAGAGIFNFRLIMNTLIRKPGPAVLLITACLAANATPLHYSFSGIITGFDSYNPNYTIEDLNVVLGVTPVSYLFEVDFDRSVSTFTNSAATWNFFFADLIGDSYAVSQLGWGGYPPENLIGFDAEFSSGNNIGELEGASSMRLFTSSIFTSDWKVGDWQIGQEFRFTDGTVVAGEPGAIYVLGSVTLDSIIVIPEPSTSSALVALIALGIALGSRIRRKCGRSGGVSCIPRFCGGSLGTAPEAPLNPPGR